MKTLCSSGLFPGDAFDQHVSDGPIFELRNNGAAVVHVVINKIKVSDRNTAVDMVKLQSDTFILQTTVVRWPVG